MSHFTVLVVVDKCNESELNSELERMFAPYQENNMDTCPSQYLEFVDCTDEVNEQWKENTNSKYETIEEFAEEHFGYTKKANNGSGNCFGYMTNPNTKWDWWVIGGRWSGFFPVKSNKENVDACQIKDLDWDQVRKNTIKSRDDFWKRWGKLKETKKEDHFSLRWTAFDLGLLKCKEENELTKEERNNAVKNKNKWDIYSSMTKKEFDKKWTDHFGPIQTFAVLN